MSENSNDEMNYETWCLLNWLVNEEASHALWRQAAREHLRDAANTTNSEEYTWAVAREATCTLSRRLAASVNYENPFPRASAYWDLLNTALSKIDWQAIAEQFLEEIRRERLKSNGKHRANTGDTVTTVLLSSDN